MRKLLLEFEFFFQISADIDSAFPRQKEVFSGAGKVSRLIAS